MKLSKRDEYEIGLSTSHYHQEHVEYLLRGYSSLLPSSIVHLQSPKSSSHPINKFKINNTNNNIDSTSASTIMSEEEIVDKMIQLVERMEHEGRVYVELRSKLRSQLTNIHQTQSEGEQLQEKEKPIIDDSSSYYEDEIDATNDATEETKVEWQTTQLISSYGAPPGPSTAMYNLTLDAIANIIAKTSNPVPYLYKARTLFQSVLARNELDQKQNLDVVNINSIPNAATFNAFIRISSNAGDRNENKKGSDEEIRDVAITNAFMGFDSAHHHNIVERNSATYNYLIQTVNRFFPDCESKGHILVALWDKCTLTEGALDENVLQSFLEVNSEGCGKKFHSWFTKDVKGIYNPEERNGFGFPLRYSKNKNRRRFDKRMDVY